jgi:hypothetical protein
MSTLNTVNITNGTDSITVEGAVKGSAKAWVNFNGTGTVAIRASYNVSSITDLGVGYYSVNFTTAFLNANYAALSTSGLNTSANPGGNTTYNRTTGSLTVSHWEASTAFDVVDVDVLVFR